MGVIPHCTLLVSSSIYDLILRDSNKEYNQTRLYSRSTKVMQAGRRERPCLCISINFKVLWHWMKRKQALKIDHDFSVFG